jgi:hypothetical protein
MVDGENRLHRVAVEKSLLTATRRCAEIWRNLQELAGIDNSHAQALLEKEKAAWEEQKQKEIEEIKGAQAETQVMTAEQVAEATKTEEKPKVEEKPPSDEPWIETPRCTTCDECTKLNGRMFAYNENKQAVIKDITAGTYRDLVEAAERCKVAIIHPGKPKNPDEPGLEELVKKAEKFNR